ncbi:uncharacterized protein ColSpa_07132 [Colletotrichum spaethianum]|uniref:Myb-like domain-containing protein n=1 Tax=Colletotrichum spaethianum TaxID=700344 RepID=A0AA37LEP7_9PEZI|nr:uncharacterized protein ColSpa_07132 [Colletotrichum spaethianum]GKT46951.1 hypothetical protein ColSpa_07132 [Colletotrichum spaethianum]
MAPNTWTDQAEKDLIWAFIKASNGGKMPKADWNLVLEMMTAMGYSFTINALSQRWSKTIVKNYGQRVNSVGNATTSASAGTLTTPTASRKRGAPASGTRASGARGRRGGQAAHEMAADAVAADDGDDDAERELEDVKPKAKRTKTSNDGTVAGLNGQRIDLTDDSQDFQTTQNPVDMPDFNIFDEIKVEGDNGYFGRGRGRDRSMTVAPPNASAAYFNAAADDVGPSQQRELDDSI